MKKLLLISITLLSFFSNSQNVIWQNYYGDMLIGGTFYDQGFSITELSNGNYFSVGYRQSQPTNGPSDVFGVSVNSDGSSATEYNFGSAGSDIGNSIISTSDNNVVVVGENNFQGNITKLSESGAIIWTTNYGANVFYDVVETTDGYVAVGHKVNGANKDVYYCKVNFDGVLQWENSIVQTGEEIAHGVAKTDNNEFIIAGFKNPTTNLDEYVIRINSSGTVLWEQTYGGAVYQDAAYDIINITNGGVERYALTGKKDNSVFLHIIGDLGQTLNNFNYANTYNTSTGYGILQRSDNSFVIIGEATTSGVDGLLLLVDAAGTQVTSSLIGSVDFNNSFDGGVLSSDNSSILLTGYENDWQGYPDMHVLKIGLPALAVDNDGDGFSAPQDCDDANALIFPGATELCDGVDNNCDGNTDEGLTTIYYLDQDVDGFGTGTGAPLCFNPGPGSSTTNDDCDDSNASVNPAATEIPNNGLDDDCVGGDATSVVDVDLDGFSPPQDCNDNDAAINPNATEVCDGVDNNCNGSVDEGLLTTYYTDADNDNFGTGTGTGFCANPGAGFSINNTDCDDANAAINPGATEVPDNGLDDDCVGGDATSGTDTDGDGFSSPQDCNDSDASINPNATEICDGIDNNCDGGIDEGLTMTTYYPDQDEDNFGELDAVGNPMCMDPGVGFSTTNDDCDDLDNAIHPGATDTPDNGIDEDCSGADATIADPVANDDTGNCIENDVNGTVQIIANDTDPSLSAPINTVDVFDLVGTHTVDLDINTASVQGTFVASAPSVTWTYNSQFQTLSCDPAQDVEGIVTLIYELCNVATTLCNQGTVTMTVAPSTASISEKTLIVSVFPNPTSNELTIHTSEKVNSVNVIGFDGKLVMSSLLIDSKINVGNITSGLYQIEVLFDSGAVSRSTFVKQ